MSQEKKPVIYLFYGDNEQEISEAINYLRSRVGDPSTADLNISTIDGRLFSFDDFETASKSMPFLTDRRLIIINNPLSFTYNESNRDKLLSLLEDVPDYNAVALVEFSPLLTRRQKKKGEKHWLEEWVRKQADRGFIKEYLIESGPQMKGWIIKRVSSAGGQIDNDAANELASMVGDDTRFADQEILKLLTYVNYERPIEKEDVLLLTPMIQEGDIFELVDALGHQDKKTAMGVFHRLLADQDRMRIFSMIVRQFRFLLLAREILDNDGNEQDILRQLTPNPFKIHPYVAKKIISQARKFSITQLETIYHLLLDIDQDMKSGKMAVDLSVDMLIADIKSTGSR